MKTKKCKSVDKEIIPFFFILCLLYYFGDKIYGRFYSLDNLLSNKPTPQSFRSNDSDKLGDYEVLIENIVEIYDS